MDSSNFPIGWAQAYLENIVEILDSMRVPVNSDDRSSRIKDKSQSQLYPYYGATGEVGKIDGYIFDEELVALGEDGVPFFDTQKTKAYLLQGKTWVNNHAHVLKAKEQVAINKYILHYLNQFDYQGYVNGATRLKLTQANMRKIPIVLAPLSEQKVIANKLDDMLAKVERIKARLECIPQILKQFRQSVLADAISGKLTEDWRQNSEFSLSLARYKKATVSFKSKANGLKDIKEVGKWLSCQLGHVISVKSGDGLTAKEMIGDGGIPVYGGNGINGYHDKFNVTEQKVVIGRVGFYCGSVHLTQEKAWITDNALIVDYPEQLFSKDFIFWLLSTINLREDMAATAQPVISGAKIYPIKLLIPPIEEQIEIARRIQKLFSFADIIEQKTNFVLEKVSGLSQSILAKAFRGELTEKWRLENPELISGENSAESLLNRIKDEKTKSDNSRKNLKMSITLPLPPLDIKMRAIVSPNKIIKVKDAFNLDSNDEDHILSGQELLLAAGYPNDADAETLERFYLDLRSALESGEIVKLTRDDGQDWFALTKYLEKNES